jgi:hypothetical protein
MQWRRQLQHLQQHVLPVGLLPLKQRITPGAAAEAAAALAVACAVDA